MSKKSRRKSRRVAVTIAAPVARNKTRRVAVVALCGALAVLLAGGSVAHWRGARLGSFAAAFMQATPTPTLLSLSKEYVYAGGRLVATEEPAGAASAAGPADLVATATQTTQVSLTWSAPASGAVDHYVVERAQSVNGPYSPLSPDPTGTGFTDGTAAAGTAYLYHVKAVFAGGASSAYSSPDLATTVVFTDDPLTQGVTTIKAQHFDELRQAVGAVRALANLQPAAWTDQTLAGSSIKAAHVEELRTNLDQALAALGITTTPYSDAPLAGVFVKKVHLEELRQRLR
jgi:hypothetical protein